MSLVEQIRADAARQKKWVRFGEYSYVCGDWTASLFVVQGVSSIALYHGHRQAGIFESFEDAFGAAKRLQEAA